MHNNKFVAAIKVGGKVLREFGDTVRIPFGSEYDIHLKNLNTRRVSVKISIDGEDVLNGSELVINANESIDLERFVKDVSKGNRFKFIERTSNVEKHRGVKAEDGLIRIEFAFERQPMTNQYVLTKSTWPLQPNNGEYTRWYGPCNVNGPLYDSNFTVSCSAVSPIVSNALRSVAQLQSDVGITVKGSISDQSFSVINRFATDASEVIVLKLVGDVGQSLVTEPVTVKRKVKCSTCGRQNKAVAKFCNECGTGLEII